PGFQLSVLATIGLIYVAPLVEECMPWVPKSFGLRAIVGATVGTQICVLPLLLYQTGSVSVVALPVNLLVLIVMPYAMFFSFLAGTLGGLVGAYAAIVAAPAYALLSWTLAVTKLFGSIPFASYAIGAFSLWWVGAAYALLGGVLVYTYRNGRVNDFALPRTALPRYSNSDF
ncbi:MAG: ComEC/Rec2 family competence protein, partial [bacterium]|nr:ComEC/Rec2 family competence protein [bacterium]